MSGKPIKLEVYHDEIEALRRSLESGQAAKFLKMDFANFTAPPGFLQLIVKHNGYAMFIPPELESKTKIIRDEFIAVSLSFLEKVCEGVESESNVESYHKRLNEVLIAKHLMDNH